MSAQLSSASRAQQWHRHAIFIGVTGLFTRKGADWRPASPNEILLEMAKFGMFSRRRFRFIWPRMALPGQMRNKCSNVADKIIKVGQAAQMLDKLTRQSTSKRVRLYLRAWRRGAKYYAPAALLAD